MSTLPPPLALACASLCVRVTPVSSFCALSISYLSSLPPPNSLVLPLPDSFCAFPHLSLLYTSPALLRQKRRKLREDSRHLSSAQSALVSAGAGGSSGAPLGLYHCDSCHRDLSGALRIRCAVCADFDLCLDCFSVGAEVHPHRNDHAYRVVESLAFSIFEPGWRADEELQLLESIAKFGLGNWARIASIVGKPEDVCRDHYKRIHLDGLIGPERASGDGAGAEPGAERAGGNDGGPRAAAPGAAPGAATPARSPPLELAAPVDAKLKGEPSSVVSAASPSLPAIATPRPEADVPTFAPGPSTAETPTFGARPRRAADAPAGEERSKGAKGDDTAVLETIQVSQVLGCAPTPSVPPLGSTPPPSAPPPASRPPSPSPFPSPGPVSPPLTLSSGPSPPALAAADVAQTGFHAKRMEFDVEYDNEAEHLIADIEPNAADTPEVREAKLRLLDAYNRRLAERVRRREWLLERNAVAVRRFTALERKRTAPERELAAQLRVFSRFLEPNEHAALVEGLLVEQRLRARIAELQELRAAGLRTFEEADKAAASAEALAEARRKGGYGAATSSGATAVGQAGLLGMASAARSGGGRSGAPGLVAGAAFGLGDQSPAGAARSNRSSARAGGSARRSAALPAGTSVPPAGAALVAAAMAATALAPVATSMPAAVNEIPAASPTYFDAALASGTAPPTSSGAVPGSIANASATVDGEAAGLVGNPSAGGTALRRIQGADEIASSTGLRQVVAGPALPSSSAPVGLGLPTSSQVPFASPEVGSSAPVESAHPLPPSLAPPPSSAGPPSPRLLRPLVPFPMLPPSKGDPGARSSAARHRSRAMPLDEVSIARAVRDDLGFWHGFGALARSLSSLDEGRGALGLQSWRSKRRALLDLDSLPDSATLTREEKALCAAERYLPAQYLAVKLQVLRLQETRGGVCQDDVVSLPFAVDASRLARLFAFFLQQGWITKAKRGPRVRS